MQTIGYLGPEGSYSQLAAHRMCPEAKLCAYTGFPQVFQSLVSGSSDAIAVPIENTLNGGVLQNLDLLQSTEGVCAVRKLTVKIDHRLVTLKGADADKIKRIYSHGQALEQCAKYLAENFPSARLVPVQSTSASLDMIKTEEDAGIAGAHNVRDGLVLSDKNIADADNNFTHFLLVKRGEVPPETQSEHIFFCVTLDNRSGTLLSLLQVVSGHALNMTKIQSRPVKNAPDEYRFFIEVEGDYSADAVKNALEAIKKASNSFKLLGCY